MFSASSTQQITIPKPSWFCFLVSWVFRLHFLDKVHGISTWHFPLLNSSSHTWLYLLVLFHLFILITLPLLYLNHRVTNGRFCLRVHYHCSGLLDNNQSPLLLDWLEHTNLIILHVDMQNSLLITQNEWGSKFKPPLYNSESVLLMVLTWLGVSQHYQVFFFHHKLITNVFQNFILNCYGRKSYSFKPSILWHHKPYRYC